MASIREFRWRNALAPMPQGWTKPYTRTTIDVCGVPTTIEDARALRDYLTATINEMERRNGNQA